MIVAVCGHPPFTRRTRCGRSASSGWRRLPHPIRCQAADPAPFRDL